jgi:CubicO group peptidase (beta-lactamase class C family)
MNHLTHIRRLTFIALILVFSSITVAQTAAPSDLDAFVERARQSFEVPGIAVAIVKEGQVVVAKGYGVRKLGEPTPVDAYTLFGIASNTKAFTTATLATLVDEGKISWDDPVINYLPNFQMSDPYVTREMTVRDLLVHRSGLGLGAGDLMFWPHTNFTRDEILHNLRYVKLATSFRSHYAYDNVLYLVAGQIIPAVTGKSWNEYIEERIFKPLGMTHSNTSVADFRPGDNVATPHSKIEGKVTPIPYNNLDNNAPAGAINSCVSDMIKWITVQLNGGLISKTAEGETRLFSARQNREMWSAHTIMPIVDPPPPLAATRPNFLAYALGWWVQDYRGHKIVSHTGGLAGLVSRVTLVPDLHLGMVVLTNAEAGGAFNSITLYVLDHYLGAPTTDWIEAYLQAQKLIEERGAEAVKKHSAERNKDSKPSLPLEKYMGRYRDAWYGDVTLALEDNHLVMRFTHTPDLVGDLEHWQYDTFVSRWRDRSLAADAFVYFSLKPDGSIDQMKMVPVSPLTDFSYDFQDLLLTPVAEKK